MKALKRRPLGVLLNYDLRFALQGPRGLLFLVFYFMIWGWLLSKLAGGAAEQLRGPEASMVMTFFMSGPMLRMFQEQPTTLSVFFVIAMTLTPWFAMLGAGDQTAGDLSTKHLRFLIPRVGRNEIYFARFLGAAVMVCGAQLIATLAATCIQLNLGTNPAATVLAFGGQIAVVLLLYSLAFVALMSLVCATIASVGLSLLTAMGGYFVILAIVGALSINWSWAWIVGCVLPSGLKAQLMQPDLGGAALALCGVLVYVGVYLFAGLRVFQVRNA